MAIAVLLSVVKAPAIPVNDPALYEYYGRRLLEGAHLYSDLPEVKLPSLYYINALYQLAFGANYVLHACVEATLNVAAISLFALLLRQYGLDGWAPATALFAVVYSLGIDQFNYPEFYAVPLILGAYYLAGRRQEIAAGVALAVATTFWVQTPILLVPLLARRLPWKRKRGSLLGFALSFLICIAAVIPILGVAWILRPIATWPGFMEGSLSALAHPADQIDHRLVWTFLHAGVAALAVLLLLVIRRPKTDAQRFALWWTACAFIGALVPPSFFPWYFVPVMPPLVMGAAAYGFTWPSLLNRAAIAVIFCGLAIYAALTGYQDALYLRTYAENVVDIGRAVREAAGPRRVLWTVDYLPEYYLAFQAVEPYAGASNGAHPVYIRRGSAEGLQVGSWTRTPDILAEGGPVATPPLRSKFWLYDPLSRARLEYLPLCRIRGYHVQFYAAPASVSPISEELKGC